MPRGGVRLIWPAAPNSAWTYRTRSGRPGPIICAGWRSYLEEAGHRLTGFDGLVHSTVPFASGLSWSAALEMAAGAAFQAAGGFRIDPVQMALIGQPAENRFVGVNSGILDQYSPSDGTGRERAAVGLPRSDQPGRGLAAGIRVVICDMWAERKLMGSEYGERRAECEEASALQAFYPGITALRDASLAEFEAHAADLPEVVARRCRFIIEENQRGPDLANVPPAGEPARLFELLAASYLGGAPPVRDRRAGDERMMAAMLGAPGCTVRAKPGPGSAAAWLCRCAKCGHRFTTMSRLDYVRRTAIQPRVYPCCRARHRPALTRRPPGGTRRDSQSPEEKRVMTAAAQRPKAPQ